MAIAWFNPNVKSLTGVPTDLLWRKNVKSPTRGPNWPFRCLDLDCYRCFCHLMIDFAIAECWTYRFHRWTLVAANSMWRAFVGWYGGFANLLIAFLQNFSNHKYFYNLNKYNFKFCQMHLICGMVQLLMYANGTYQRFKGTVVALCNACSVFRLRQMENINTFRAVICNNETVKIQKNVRVVLEIHYSIKKSPNG